MSDTESTRISAQHSLLQQRQFVCDFITVTHQKRGYVLLDGAMGTSLFVQGLQSGDSPELWNLTQKEKIKTIYRSYLEEGSDIILTNSFGGSAARLKLHKLENQVHELNQFAASLAKEAIADCRLKGSITDDSLRLVGGSVGPLGELLQPMGPMSKAEAEELFYQQIIGLKAGGADLIWIETMSLLDEVDAAYQAAIRAEIPACITLSFDMNGKTMMGVSEQEFCRYAQALSPKPVAIGFNCGLGFSDSLLTLKGLLEHAGDLPVIAKSNCGLPVFKEGKIHFDGTPELMRDYAVMARDAGATIIGGCCGSTSHHVGAMYHALQENSKIFQGLERKKIETIFGAARVPSNKSVAQMETDIARKKSGRRRRLS